MAILKHEIEKSIKGSLGQTEDWWYLCYDTDTGEFFVEHEWDHANPYPRGGPGHKGTERHDVANWQGPGCLELEKAKAILIEQANAQRP